ncbi:MAG: peptidylprolyl isomerase [Acidobacteriota bacterium]
MMRYDKTSVALLGTILVFAFTCTSLVAVNQAQSKEQGVQTNQPQPKPNPDPAKATEQAPEKFRVKLDTTKGSVTIEVVRAWAPKGADRFYNLVKLGYFTDIAFFRVIDGFMAQFGIHGDPAVSARWRNARIPDDPVKQSNLRGFVSFAMAGPNTRTTQLFINYADRNSQLDRSGFSPFGRVIDGMENVDNLYSGYGEGAPNGRGPNQGLVQTQGNAYLRNHFPHLDYIKSATIVE